MREITIPAKIERLPEALDFVRGVMEADGAREAEIMAVEIICEEVFVNIAQYAYAPGEGEASIACEIVTEPRAVRVRFSDAGVPYDPLQKADPDISLGATDRPIGGLGIYMTKKMMDEVAYAHENGRNVLTITKRLR